MTEWALTSDWLWKQPTRQNAPQLNKLHSSQKSLHFSRLKLDQKKQNLNFFFSNHLPQSKFYKQTMTTYVGRLEGKEILLLYKWLWIVDVSQAPWNYIQKNVDKNKLIAQKIKGLNCDLFFFSSWRWIGPNIPR